MSTISLPKTDGFDPRGALQPTGTPTTRQSQPSKPRRKLQPDRTGTEVVVLNDPAAMETYLPQWEALAGNALEPNLFYEPWMLLPALRHYADESVKVAFVIKHRGGGARPLLLGVVPLAFSRSFGGLPIATARFWKHPHCYLANPLVAREAEMEFWSSLFHWLQDYAGAGPLLEMRTLSGDGPLLRSLLSYTFEAGLPLHMKELYSRALLQLQGGSGEDYLRSTMGGDHRRGYARKRRQLEEKGDLQVCEFQEGDSHEDWAADFLRVEGSGWKREAATAIACNPRDRDFFDEVTREAARRKRLMMMALKLDGKAIAVHHGIHAGEGSFALKIGYDESLGQYSPGMLLEIEAIHALHRDRPCQWVDCCSASGSLVMKRVWKQQRLIASVVCPTGKHGGRLLVAAMPMLRYMKRRLGSVWPHEPRAA